MEAGHIRQSGPPAELYRQPVSRFVADFMGETNWIEGTVKSFAEGVAQVARCIELGADDYLHKPVNPMLLKARVGSSRCATLP